MGEGQGLLLRTVGAEESARSHLTWSPEAFPGFPLSSTLSVQLELVSRKGLRPPSSPSASLSHCHPLFISPDARLPVLAGQAGPPLHAPPHLSHTATEAGEEEPPAARAAETWRPGWVAGPAGSCPSSHLLLPSPADPPVPGSPGRRCPSRFSALCPSPLERRPQGPWEMFGVPSSGGGSGTTQNQKRRRKRRKRRQ